MRNWIMTASSILAGALAAASAAPQTDAVPFSDALERSSIALTTLDEPINDALILGNGDLNGLLFVQNGDLVFRITKNDVWDARLDAELNPPVPTLKRLKELGAGEWPDREWILPEGMEYDKNDAYHAHPYPCPRACAVLRLTGVAARPPLASLDIRRARARVVSDDASTALFIPEGANVIIAEAPPGTVAAIEPILSADIPAAETGRTGECTWITQSIPGDADWPGMSFTVACHSRDGRAAVTVVTSLESADPLRAAVALAEESIEDARLASLKAAHEQAWEAFWGRSGLRLADEVLERVWYRNLYFLRCVSKPGVVSTGLFAGLLDDAPAWHGDYHTNYNIQQTYWAAYASNHCDLTEPYDRLITEYLPRARWLAREIFDCGGAYYPHVLFAYEPPNPEQCKSPHGRQYIHHVWGFTLGVDGFTVQPLWWHYTYEPDRTFLESVAYPAVRDVAEFYTDFVEQCERDGDRVVLGPTVSPEHHGWTPDFELNRNGTFCIAYFHFVFDAAIEGATVLGRDEVLVARWRAAKALLPAYPLGGDDPQVVVDVAGADPIVYNIPVPITPVFPGDQVGVFSEPATRDLFTRTLVGLQHNGNNAPVMLAMARARLATPDARDWLHTELAWRERRNGTLSFNRLDPRFHFNDFGHYTEMFGAAWPVSELLLQSVGDVVRVFPAWPGQLPAAFERLRAQGGFLVSASNEGGLVASLRVESTVGGELRLAVPWSACEVCRGDGPWEPAQPDAAGVIAVSTQAGERLTFRAKPA